jgi:hypothetical protein
MRRRPVHLAAPRLLISLALAGCDRVARRHVSTTQLATYGYAKQARVVLAKAA